MARIWNQTEDALRAARAVADVMRATGELPTPLAEAYRASLRTSTPGLVQRFYERLATECPDALRYFTDGWMAAVDAKGENFRND